MVRKLVLELCSFILNSLIFLRHKIIIRFSLDKRITQNVNGFSISGSLKLTLCEPITEAESQNGTSKEERERERSQKSFENINCHISLLKLHPWNFRHTPTPHQANEYVNTLTNIVHLHTFSMSFSLFLDNTCFSRTSRTVGKCSLSQS